VEFLCKFICKTNSLLLTEFARLESRGLRRWRFTSSSVHHVFWRGVNTCSSHVNVENSLNEHSNQRRDYCTRRTASGSCSQQNWQLIIRNLMLKTLMENIHTHARVTDPQW